MVGFSVFIVIFFIFFLSYMKERNFLSPAVLCSCLWTFFVGIYLFVDHGLYAVSSQTYFCLLIWVLFFSIGCSVSSVVSLNTSTYVNKSSGKVLFFISLYFVPYVIYQLFIFVSSIDISLLFHSLRMRAVSNEASGISDYFFTVAYMSFLYHLYEFVFQPSSKTRKRLIIIIIINLLFCFIAVSKANVILLFFPLFLVFVTEGIISKLHFLLGVFSILLLFFVIQSLRAVTEGQNLCDIFQELFYYFLAGFPAFDQIVAMDYQSPVFGNYTFGFFYRVLNAVGCDFPVVNNVGLGYQFVPVPTNVYTVLFAPYLDFGYLGLCIVGLFQGAVSGLLWDKYKRGDAGCTIIYPYFATIIILQFFSEYFFMNLSYTIQIFFWSYLLTHHFKIKPA